MMTGQVEAILFHLARKQSENSPKTVRPQKSPDRPGPYSSFFTRENIL